MSDKVSKKDLITSFRSLNKDNLITLNVICERLILDCNRDKEMKDFMFDDDEDFNEFLSFVKLFKQYLFHDWPIAYHIGVHVDER